MQFKGTAEEVAEQIANFAREKKASSVTVQIVWWEPFFPEPKITLPPYDKPRDKKSRDSFKTPLSEERVSRKTCKICIGTGVDAGGGKCFYCGGRGDVY